MGPGSLIVIMTDFGMEHWYDAAMKGEILRRAPHATVLDLSHEVPRHSVEAGAFLLHCAIDSFARQTIFLCVVDPGVGSKRKTLVGWVGEYGFVGPDNGLVTPLMERSGGDFELHEIKSPTFRNERVSATFHGRDLFAPAAARLLLGDDPRMAGPRVENPVRLPPFRAERKGNQVIGRVMLVDHFGNAVTNIAQTDMPADLDGKRVEFSIRNLRLNHIETTYAERVPQEALCYWGSSGFLEVAINFGSAAESFGISVGDPATSRSNRDETSPPYR
jgi:S-adenosylmethionine hydrolase